jgi:ppGpp synthetase/RelA/SpoT-type nucleotidyltranferase
MKANYKKYNIGGMLQSTSSPMISQGMQGSLSSWGGSPTAVFNEGGKTEKTMDAMLGKKINALVGKSIMLFGEGQSMPTTQKITEVRLSPPSFRYRDLFFKVKGSDFEERIPQHDIVRFLLGEQVDVYNPAKGEYYAWQLSRGKMMARGGYTKRYSKDEIYRVRQKQMHERTGGEGVGNFELPKDRNTRYLYELDEFDQNFLKDIKIKPNEYIFRWESETSKIGGYIPFVKINLENQRVYFLTEKAMSEGKAEFSKKGEKAKFVNISDKYTQGGMLPNGRSSYGKGDEGMYEGSEVRVISYNKEQDGYVFDILDDDKVVSRGMAKGKDFEKQFAYFPKKEGAVMKNGGKAEVKIENKDVKFDKKLYKGVLDDFDLDGLPNADDPNPLKSGDGASVEQTKLSTAVNNVIRVKDKMDVELDEFIGKLQKTAPNDSKIYGRTKTPYSILNKLVSTRLLDQKRGLQDLVGTTVAFNNFDDLVKFKKRVEKGMFGKVVEFKDYYENPNDGYRAYHFIVEQNGTPIELQLKTDRMKQVNVLSHDAYKNKDLDVDYLLYLTTIANEADKGNAASKAEFERVMSDRVAVKKKLSSGKTQ